MLLSIDKSQALILNQNALQTVIKTCESSLNLGLSRFVDHLSSYEIPWLKFSAVDKVFQPYSTAIESDIEKCLWNNNWIGIADKILRIDLLEISEQTNMFKKLFEVLVDDFAHNKVLDMATENLWIALCQKNARRHLLPIYRFTYFH